MSETATESKLPAHGAVSPAPQNVGEGYQLAKHERTGEEEQAPPGLVGAVQFFLERFGHMMSRIVLTVLYVVLIAPVGIFYRFIANPFDSNYRGTSLVPWRSKNSTLDEARRQG